MDITTKVKYPPMANGPIKRPAAMKMIELTAFKRKIVPAMFLTVGCWATALYFFNERKKEKIYNYYKTFDPDECFHKIKEFGVLRTVKASWQEE